MLENGLGIHWQNVNGDRTLDELFGSVRKIKVLCPYERGERISGSGIWDLGSPIDSVTSQDERDEVLVS